MRVCALSHIYHLHMSASRKISIQEIDTNYSRFLARQRNSESLIDRERIWKHFGIFASTITRPSDVKVTGCVLAHISLWIIHRFEYCEAIFRSDWLNIIGLCACDDIEVALHGNFALRKREKAKKGQGGLQQSSDDVMRTGMNGSENRFAAGEATATSSIKDNAARFFSMKC